MKKNSSKEAIVREATPPRIDNSELHNSGNNNSSNSNNSNNNFLTVPSPPIPDGGGEKERKKSKDKLYPYGPKAARVRQSMINLSLEKGFLEEMQKQEVKDVKDVKDELLDDDLLFPDVLQDEEDQKNISHFEEIKNMLGIFFKDFEGKYLDLFFGSLLVASFHDYREDLTMQVIPIGDEVWKKGRYYMKFAAAAYGNLLSCLKMRKKFFSGEIMNLPPKGDKRVVFEHTGIAKEDFIVGWWGTVAMGGSEFIPGHYLCIDHQSQAVVLAVRGSSNFRDGLIDMVANYIAYKDGAVHKGMFHSSKLLFEKLKDAIFTALADHPTYTLVVCGHSLGAGVTSLITLLIHDEYPDIPIHGYCYAPPCTMDAILSEECKGLISSFILGDDCVPRASYGSLEELKETMKHFLSHSGTGFSSRLYMVTKHWTGIQSGKLAKVFRVSKEEAKKKIMDYKPENRGEYLYPAGIVYHMYKNQETKQVEGELSEYNRFGHIVISRNMFTDHMPHKYEKFLKKMASPEYRSMSSQTKFQSLTNLFRKKRSKNSVYDQTPDRSPSRDTLSLSLSNSGDNSDHSQSFSVHNNNNNHHNNRSKKSISFDFDYECDYNYYLKNSNNNNNSNTNNNNNNNNNNEEKDGNIIIIGSNNNSNHKNGDEDEDDDHRGEDDQGSDESCDTSDEEVEILESEKSISSLLSLLSDESTSPKTNKILDERKQNNRKSLMQLHQMVEEYKTRGHKTTSPPPLDLSGNSTFKSKTKLKANKSHLLHLHTIGEKVPKSPISPISPRSRSHTYSSVLTESPISISPNETTKSSSSNKGSIKEKKHKSKEKKPKSSPREKSKKPSPSPSPSPREAPLPSPSPREKPLSVEEIEERNKLLADSLKFKEYLLELGDSSQELVNFLTSIFEGLAQKENELNKKEKLLLQKEKELKKRRVKL